MTEEIAEQVSSGKVHQYGTFNGNPLVMAASQATLTEVLTEDVYPGLERTNERLKAACQEIIDRYGLPAYTEGMGAKGCVIFAAEPLREYRDYLTKVDGELSTLAWLYHMNHGIFMTPGVEEEWTLSIAHSDEDIEHYVDRVRGVCARRDVELSRPVRPSGRAGARRGRRWRSRA